MHGGTPALSPIPRAALGWWDMVGLSGVRVKEVKREHEGGNGMEAEQGKPC